MRTCNGTRRGDEEEEEEEEKRRKKKEKKKVVEKGGRGGCSLAIEQSVWQVWWQPRYRWTGLIGPTVHYSCCSQRGETFPKYFIIIFERSISIILLFGAFDIAITVIMQPALKA